ncbi:hypothetical protein GEMRC1_008510 [Eukaryota sp. GEM-RC1]
MDCPFCCHSYNLSIRIPVIICSRAHTCCAKCADRLSTCPFCRHRCFSSKKVNFGLKDLVEAAQNGDMCPQIPSSQIQVKEEIAEGGFAIVYDALWFSLPVAVKMVSLTSEGRIKLQQELSLLHNLSHPAILRVFGISYFGDRIGIVMEKATSHLPTPNTISSTTIQFALDLCQAVAFLHSRSIVHGDLKPANILVVDDRVRLADFGTSRNVAATTLVKNNTYTPRYAAPEQFENLALFQSDIYSIGLVLYELFSGNEVYEDLSIMRLAAAKLKDLVLDFPATFPATLRSIIQQCVNINPDLRPELSEVMTIVKKFGHSEVRVAYSELVEENTMLNNEVSKLRGKCDGLENLHQQAQEGLKSLESVLSQRDLEIVSLQEQLAELNKEVVPYRRLQSVHKKVQEQLISLESVLSQRDLEIVSLQEQLAAAKQLNKEVVENRRKQDFHKKVQEEVSQRDLEITSLQQQLETSNYNLQSLKDRISHLFHFSTRSMGPRRSGLKEKCDSEKIDSESFDLHLQVSQSLIEQSHGGNVSNSSLVLGSERQSILSDSIPKISQRGSFKNETSNVSPTAESKRLCVGSLVGKFSSREPPRPFVPKINKRESENDENSRRPDAPTSSPVPEPPRPNIGSLVGKFSSGEQPRPFVPKINKRESENDENSRRPDAPTSSPVPEPPRPNIGSLVGKFSSGEQPRPFVPKINKRESENDENSRRPDAPTSSPVPEPPRPNIGSLVGKFSSGEQPRPFVPKINKRESENDENSRSPDAPTSSPVPEPPRPNIGSLVGKFSSGEQPRPFVPKINKRESENDENSRSPDAPTSSPVPEPPRPNIGSLVGKFSSGEQPRPFVPKINKRESENDENSRSPEAPTSSPVPEPPRPNIGSLVGKFSSGEQPRPFVPKSQNDSVEIIAPKSSFADRLKFFQQL